jgi:hypothetical protein
MPGPRQGKHRDGPEVGAFKLNQFANSFPVACEKQETVTHGTAAMLKTILGYPDAEKARKLMLA